MICRISSIRNYSTILGSPIRYVKGTLLSFTFIIVFFMGTAWSFEKIYKPTTINNSAHISNALYNTKLPSSPVMDMCKSLLKSTQHISSHISTGGSQRAAGKIAALGIILGVRFALEPKNNENVRAMSVKNHVLRHQKKVLGNRSAQAVIAYRRCQKEHALNKVATSA
ncbi:MAG: hypothetical protein COA45_06505 [Zetaproteobacteria bacterium]|nr:MAG: hypothetical protein COA45_06505 [Zetaproteobacteria bacterium]